jgi:hypothetical protein
MATVVGGVGQGYPNGGPLTPPPGVSLSAAQTGNGASSNVCDRGGSVGPALLKITTTVGGGPTCTYAIEGSADGTNWFAIPYADSATPTTTSVATFAITTATTVYKYLLANYPWRYARVTFSSNTNVTNTVDCWTF